MVLFHFSSNNLLETCHEHDNQHTICHLRAVGYQSKTQSWNAGRELTALM